jgi:hypothetical protein
MKTEPLILAGDGFQLAIAPEAETLKAELLQSAAAITRVSGPDENETARTAIKALGAMRNAVEKSRKLVKEPVLQIGRDIDAKAKDFVGQIEAEEKRVAGLLADYATEVERERQRVLREMEAQRQAEEKSRREEEAAARAAEAARIAAEQAEWEATDDAQAAKAAQAAQEAAEKARMAAEQAAKAAAAEASKPILVPAKAAGVKFTLDYEVADIERLYHTRPEFVKLEPKRAEILAYLKTLHDTEHLEAGLLAMGLKLVRKPVVSTR